MQNPELLTPEVLERLIGHKIEEATYRFSAILKIIEILDDGMYFVPGFMNQHRNILNLIEDMKDRRLQRSDLGWVGEISHLDLGPESFIELRSGGSTLKSLEYEAIRQDEAEGVVVAMLGKISSNLPVKWSV